MLSHDTPGSSIRKQLLLWLLIPLVCLCTVSSLVAYRLAETFANQSYDLLLVESAESIMSRLSRNEAGIVVADLPIAAQAILRHNGRDRFFYQIADSQGHRLTGDAVLPLPANVDVKGPRFRYGTVQGTQVRICRLAVQIAPSTDDIWIQVAETLHSRHWLLQQIFLSIMIPQLVLVLLASFSVWLGVKHGLEPLDRLGALLKSKIDLTSINIGNTPAELAPVIKALNELFANVDNQISRQRRFIGDAAHQLRTPVTALRTYVDHARRLPEDISTPFSSLLKQMSEATDRITHTINRLLSLARTEEGSLRSLELVDLVDVINDAAANVINEALERKVNLEFDIPDTPVNVFADRADLVEMFTNLIDNAIKYSGANCSVWVTMKLEDNIVVTVEDNGPGIPDAQKQKVFERFYRIPGSNVTGCGLGLSIVSEIAASSGLTIQVRDRQGGGTIVQISFPHATLQKMSGDSRP